MNFYSIFWNGHNPGDAVFPQWCMNTSTIGVPTPHLGKPLSCTVKDNFALKLLDLDAVGFSQSFSDSRDLRCPYGSLSRSDNLVSALFHNSRPDCLSLSGVFHDGWELDGLPGFWWKCDVFQQRYGGNGNYIPVQRMTQELFYLPKSLRSKSMSV